RRKCLSVLCKICSRQALVPSSLQIPLCYDPSAHPRCIGGFANVWMGEHEGNKVAVKVLTVYTFIKEVIMWRSLRHPNVHPMLGVTMSSRHFAMVSEWMINGNINEFLKEHRSVNRFELLKDVTRGLIYMHDLTMVHGDLKGGNILIDQDYHARLADFGLLTFVTDAANPTVHNSIAGTGGTTRWMSPELLDPESFGFEDSRPTKESDYYALGMVILEVLSGQAPFFRFKEFLVVPKVIDSEHPERPKVTWLTDDLWRVLEKCWSSQPKDRPTVRTVLDCLERVSVATTVDCQQRLIDRSFSQELFTSEAQDYHPTRHSDCYALGMVIYEVLTLRVPFYQYQNLVISGKVVRGERPERLEGADGVWLTDGVWGVLERCWEPEPQDRPGIEDVLRCLEERLSSWVPPSSDSTLRRRCIRALRKTCGLYGVLPTSYTIAFTLQGRLMRPFASGGFSDIWKMVDEANPGCHFAVKSLHVYEGDPIERINKRYCKDVVVHKHAVHPNIVPFEGVAPTLFEISMVTRWMELGDILSYTMQHPGVNRLELSNILIDMEGNPRLSDFGRCSITRNIDSVNASTPNHCSTVRYCAPERLDHEETWRAEKNKPTKKSDVYSYSMLVTGQVPFADSTEYNVVSIVLKGKRPPKPRRFDAPGTSEAVWKVAQKCWHGKAHKRPEVKEALQYLNDIKHGGE
ncbi:kinase-like domain-containing protein, partial [Thelephora terrestris]